MCGIAGWAAYDRDLSSDRSIAAMTETMACRGPDALGIWRDRHVALGHRRLSVIDLQRGTQPMIAETPQGEIALVYSGEVYNFTDIRHELISHGHCFRTGSDTEVVLRGYLEWELDIARRLNGMYAFAIWDTRKETLTLVRDRMGVKPLYIYPTESGVIFGSEAKAILAHPRAEHAVSLDGFRELFSMVKSPRQSIWKGMSEVEPGTAVTVDRRGIRELRYWQLKTTLHADSRGASVDHIQALLNDSVTRQLIADVPRCTLLSGGLDSSAMTAIAARELRRHGEQVRTFSVDFAGQTDGFQPDEIRSTPDTPFVHDVAAKSATDHTDIVLDSAELADPLVREHVIRAYDLPLSHGDMDSSLFLLFKNIRKRSTVALSGESADEVFGGYHQFFSPRVRQAQTFPWLAEPHLPQYAAIDQRRPQVFTDEFERALNLHEYVHSSYVQAISEVDFPDGENDLERTMRKISYLYLTRFVRILLDRQDRLGMAVGLEVRVPFCDDRLVTYVYNTPWALKSFDSREKSLLRAAASGILPQSVVGRVKSPYPSTQDEGYAKALQVQAKDLLGTHGHPVFDLVRRDQLARAARSPASTAMYGRFVLEQALDIALWLDIYKPKLEL